MLKQLAGVAVLATALMAQTGGIEGDWIGTLAAGAMKVRLGLHIRRGADGSLVSTLDSIDQGAMGLAVQSTTFTGGRLHLDMPNMRATYDGALSSDGISIEGTFTQGGAAPLTFGKAGTVAGRNRPQLPKPPFPYDTEETAYNTPAGIHLAGTLAIPKGDGPFPAAILISGSGPQDRDESLFEHKPFLVIADYLARRGTAVLRVDDRGVGKSSGSSQRATMDDMAADVLAGVAFLKGHKRVDARRIGVIGHSEGGVVGPLAASRSADIAFVVLLAGPGVTGEELLYRQAELIARSGGAGDAAVAQNRALQKMIFDVLRSGPDEETARTRLRAEWERLKTSMAPEIRRQMANGDAAIEQEFSRVLSPEMRSFVFLDPAAALRKLKVPVLALFGSRDIQVPPQQSLPAVRAALAGNPDATVTELSGLNHLFQKCNSCIVTEYGDIEETFSPAALEAMGDWLAKHTRAR